MNGVKREVFEKMLSPNLLKASRKLRFEHRLAMAVAESDDSGRTKEDTWCGIRDSRMVSVLTRRRCRRKRKKKRK